MNWKHSAFLIFLAAPVSTQLHAQAVGAKPSPAPTVTVDPSGKFDVEVVLGSGQAGTGRLVITGTPGKYEGTLAADGGQGPLTVTSVTFSQDTVLVNVAPPGGGQGGIVMHLKFTGSGFAGHFEGAENGQIKGTKVG